MERLTGWEDVLTENVISDAEKAFAMAENDRESGKTVYPPPEKVFSAFRAVRPGDVKLVILGQDPYHEPSQANGMAFSVSHGVPLPPSLKNIYKELQADTGILRTDGNLSGWAEQGVLLLNTVLTVEAGKANSHKNYGWQKFTEAVICWCAKNTECFFFAWGNQAYNVIKKSAGGTDLSERMIVSTHPSPLSANNRKSGIPAFMGSRPFSRCNEMLAAAGKPPIDWSR